MRRCFVDKIDSDLIKIFDEDFYHLTTVLRSKIGDEVVCLCNDNFEYFCEIVDIQKHYLTLKIISKKVCEKNPKFQIDLFQALPKGEKLELIIQKVNELGASNVFPFISEFTVAKGNPIKIQRMEKIAKESSKQCGRSLCLNISEILKFDDVLKKLNEYDLVLFLYEKENLSQKISELNDEIIKSSKIAVVVGSEGGFSEKEINCLFSENVKKIWLGERILRTETASISMLAYISFLKGN